MSDKEMRRLKADLKDADSCITRRNKVIDYQESEIETLQEQNKHLKQRELELMAQVERLKQAACDLNTHIAKFSAVMWDENGAQITGVNIDDIDLSCDVLEAETEKTPQQSLAEHDEEVAARVIKLAMAFDCVPNEESVYNKIRQQATKD